MPTGQERIRSTDKFRILDSFRYDNWRTPGLWDTSETNIFGQMQPGLVGLAQPQAVFTAATFLSLCPAPYTAATCPPHTASSSADVVNGPTSSFLGQNMRSNTFRTSVRLQQASDRPNRLCVHGPHHRRFQRDFLFGGNVLCRAEPAARLRTIFLLRAEPALCLPPARRP